MAETSTDRFANVLGQGRSTSGRPGEKWAVVDLSLATPMRPEADAEDIAQLLLDQAELAVGRARSIRALIAAGWQMLPAGLRADDNAELAAQLSDTVRRQNAREPFAGVATTPDGYVDIEVRFTKPFASEEGLEADLRAIAPDASFNDDTWSVAWNVTDNGHHHEWAGAVGDLL